MEAAPVQGGGTAGPRVPLPALLNDVDAQGPQGGAVKTADVLAAIEAMESARER